MKLIHYDADAKNAIGIFIPHLGCPHLCVFCNQHSISGAACLPRADEIEGSVVKALRSGRDPKGFELAFFGGSFTSIDRGAMQGYLDIAQRLIQKYVLYGLRISARPDGIDEDILRCLKNAGITTIELGAQSMNDTVLAASGRGHTAQQVRDAAALVKSHGIQLVLQMMTGLPGDDDAGALTTADALAALSPDAVRVYPLLVLTGTELEKIVHSGSYQPQSLNDAVSLCAGIAENFYQKGIPIIKLGLHASSDFTAGALIAGPYHEAFRELVDGRIIRTAAEKVLLDAADAKQLTVRCNAADISKAVGHRRENAEYFSNKYGVAYRVSSAELAPGEFELVRW